MNKNIQLFSTSFLLAVVLLASCSKKKDETKPAPDITIDSLSGSSNKSIGYYNGSSQSFTIYYTVKASENLSRVTYSESATKDMTKNINPPVKTTPDFTAFGNPTQYSASYTTNIPVNASSLDVTISAFDIKGKTSSIKFNARTFVTYEVGFGGTDNTTYGPYLASTSFNNTYKESEFAANAGKIDVTFAQIGNPTLVPNFISTQQRATIQMSKGAGSVTTYFKTSTLNFDNVTAAQLANLTASTEQMIQIVTATPGQIYEFVSPTTGAKGLIKINSYNNGGVNVNNSNIVTNIKVVNTK